MLHGVSKVDNVRLDQRVKDLNSPHCGTAHENQKDSRMTRKISPVPKGYRTVTPYLTVSNAPAAIAFYQVAFGAEEKSRVCGDDGITVLHCELNVGNSIVLLADEVPEAGIHSPLALGGTPTLLHLYVKDADELWQQALAAGATEIVPLTETYWGDRCGKLRDPFGHVWSIASKVERVNQEEVQARAWGAPSQVEDAGLADVAVPRNEGNLEASI